MVKQTLFLTVAFMVVSFGQWANGATGSTTICRWKDNKTAAFSMSDDGPQNATDFAYYTSLLNPKGLKMTFYTVPALVDAGYVGSSWDEHRRVAAMGHEIGSHSLNHPCNTGCVLSEQQIRAELGESKARIEQEIPGNGKCLSLGYPCDCAQSAAMRAVVPEYYLAARSDDGAFTCAGYPASPPLDPLASGSMFHQNTIGRLSNSGIDLIISCGGWGNENPEDQRSNPALAAHIDYIYSKRDVLWTATVRDVAQYINERNASTVQVISASSSQIVLNLTHSLDTTLCVFDFPLTLKTEVPATWDSVTVMQGSSMVMVYSVADSGKEYACFNARPNKGQITLSAAGPTAIRYGKSQILGKAIKHLYPNPVRADILRRYLETNRKAMVYDLAGKPVDLARQPQAGLYVLQGGPMYLREKILITD